MVQNSEHSWRVWLLWSLTRHFHLRFVLGEFGPIGVVLPPVRNLGLPAWVLLLFGVGVGTQTVALPWPTGTGWVLGKAE